MAFFHGKAGTFIIDNSAGALTNISTGMTDVSLPQSADTIEVTGFTDTAKNFVMGLKGANGSISGALSTAVDTVLQGILGSTDTKSFEHYPFSTSVSGSAYKKGECFVTSYETKQSVSGAWTYSAGFIITGGITSTTVT